MQQTTQSKFIELALEVGALQFGDFTLKSGRQSPYFFNASLFNHGLALKKLGQCFYEVLETQQIDFDMLFGPAYKGIALATATAIAANHPLPVAFNRKEAKTHGEKGTLMGAPLKDKVLIIDDVITNGQAKLEAIEIIQSAGATPCGIIIALDRQERGQGQLSAKQALEQEFKIPVYAIATLQDITAYLETYPKWHDSLEKIRAYQSLYGV